MYKARERNKLPTYWGITVDTRCRQFRYIRKNGEIVFLDMKNDDWGDLLLARMIRHGLITELPY